MANYKPKDFLLVAELIGAYFEQAERDIVAMIAKNADKHMSQEQSQWLRSQQVNIANNRKMIEALVEQYQKDGAKVLNRLAVRMYLAGIISADDDLIGQGLMSGAEVISTETAVPYTDGTTLTGSLGIVHAGAVNALASAYLGVVSDALFQITRRSDDIYKKIVAEATSSALLGAKTRQEATQDAINKFMKNGVGGFRDKRGRWWSLGAYTQMATRTLITQALNEGKVNRYTEMDNDLVIVSSHQRSCELCRPWQRKILSLSGKSQQYPAFDQAKGSGLFHPNCGHTFTAYIEGLTKIDDNMTPKEAELDQKAYENQQQLRALERRMRKLKIEEAKAVSPAQKAKIQAKIREHSSKIKEFCDRTGIPRKRSNERISRADLMKRADVASTPKAPPKATGSTRKPKPTQNSGATSKGQEKPKETPKKGMSEAEIKRQQNLENFKRLKAQAEARKKAEEERKKAEQFKFDMNIFTDPNMPEGLRKKIYDRTVPTLQGPLTGKQFEALHKFQNPLHGMTTADKIADRIKDRFRSKDATELANAYQYYLTGHHLATPHKFTWTAEEWAEVCSHTDPTRVAGFNRGGFEIWYNDAQSKLIKNILDRGSFSGHGHENWQAVNVLNTLIHEQIHSIRYDHKKFADYRSHSMKKGTTMEEGVTQYVSLNLVENFATFAGLLDNEADRNAFREGYKTFIKRSPYMKEVGHIGIMSYLIGDKMGLSEKQMTAILTNAKEHVTMSPEGLAEAFSGLLGVDQTKLALIFNDYVDSYMNATSAVSNINAVVRFAKAIGANGDAIEAVERVLQDHQRHPYATYLVLKTQFWGNE